MTHYQIDIPVKKEEVKIIKEQFNKFLEESGGMTIEASAIEDGVDPSPELLETIKSLFIRLIALIELGKFKGLN